MISTKESAELSAEPTKFTTFSLRSANVLKDTTLLMEPALSVKLKKHTMPILSHVKSLLAQESMNTSQKLPILAFASPDMLELEEYAPTATLDTTMTVTLIDVFASQDSERREDSVSQNVLETKDT